MDLARPLCRSLATAAANQTDESTKMLNGGSSGVAHAAGPCDLCRASIHPKPPARSVYPCDGQCRSADLRR
jgi:hypothetical protein